MGRSGTHQDVCGRRRLGLALTASLVCACANSRASKAGDTCSGNITHFNHRESIDSICAHANTSGVAGLCTRLDGWFCAQRPASVRRQRSRWLLTVSRNSGRTGFVKMTGHRHRGPSLLGRGRGRRLPWRLARRGRSLLLRPAHLLPALLPWQGRLHRQRRHVLGQDSCQPKQSLHRLGWLRAN